MSVNPVFLDESGRRWKVVRPLLVAGATTLVAIPISLVLSIQNVSVTPQTSSEPEAQFLSQVTERPIERTAWSSRVWRVSRQGSARAARHE